MSLKFTLADVEVTYPKYSLGPTVAHICHPNSGGIFCGTRSEQYGAINPMGMRLCKKCLRIEASMTERHYAVVSPEIELYPATPYGFVPEPAEYGCCYGEYLAENRNDAIKQAFADKEFSKWKQWARDCEIPSRKGISARLARCKHKTCYVCEDECIDCKIEYDKDWELECM